MTDWRKETVDTYNRSAKDLAEYFRGIGSRNDDIEKALKLAGNPTKPKIVEIGCGDGRDAKEIIKHTKDYVGFDISEGLIELAKKHVPGAKFEVADAVGYKYPSNLDVVFAFASLLHLDKDEVQQVLQIVSDKLKAGGIFYISLKFGDNYQEFIKHDKYGKRQFFLYNPEIIKQLAPKDLKVVHAQEETHGYTKWFEIALQKL